MNELKDKVGKEYANIIRSYNRKMKNLQNECTKYDIKQLSDYYEYIKCIEKLSHLKYELESKFNYDKDALNLAKEIINEKFNGNISMFAKKYIKNKKFRNSILNNILKEFHGQQRQEIKNFLQNLPSLYS